MTSRLTSPSIYIQVVVAALIYNLMHAFAWELPIAHKLDWRINIIGACVFSAISVVSIILILMRRRFGLIFGMISAIWPLSLQWILVYLIQGYSEPNGVWWYPLFPIFQGALIIYFAVRALQYEP